MNNYILFIVICALVPSLMGVQDRLVGVNCNGNIHFCIENKLIIVCLSINSPIPIVANIGCSDEIICSNLTDTLCPIESTSFTTSTSASTSTITSLTILPTTFTPPRTTFTTSTNTTTSSTTPTKTYVSSTPSGTTSSVTTTSIVSTSTTTLASTTPYNYVNKTCAYEGQKLPDPTDCRSFLVCIKYCGALKPISLSCSLNLTYDPILQKCSSTLDCQPAIKPNPPQCKCGDTNIQDPLDPTRYYACIPQAEINIVKVQRFCTPGFVFNATENLCNFANGTVELCELPTDPPIPNSLCVDPNTLSNKPLDVNSNCSSAGIFPDKYNCAVYHICQLVCGSLEKSILTCPILSKYDPIKKACTTDINAQCLCSAVMIGSLGTCEKEGVFPDPTCPKAFFSCQLAAVFSFLAKRLSCVSGLLFDPKLSSCTNKTNLDDNDSSSSSSTSHSSSMSSEKSRSSDISSYGFDSSEELRIPCKHRHFLEVKGECNTFYRCNNGYLKKESCSKSKAFDKTKRKCLPKKWLKLDHCKDVQIETNVNINIRNNV